MDDLINDSIIWLGERGLVALTNESFSVVIARIRRRFETANELDRFLTSFNQTLLVAARDSITEIDSSFDQVPEPVSIALERRGLEIALVMLHNPDLVPRVVGKALESVGADEDLPASFLESLESTLPTMLAMELLDRSWLSSHSGDELKSYISAIDSTHGLYNLGKDWTTPPLESRFRDVREYCNFILAETSDLPRWMGAHPRDAIELSSLERLRFLGKQPRASLMVNGSIERTILESEIEWLWVLGDAGTGKSWLLEAVARITAKRASRRIDASLDVAELPLLVRLGDVELAMTEGIHRSDVSRFLVESVINRALLRGHTFQDKSWLVAVLHDQLIEGTGTAIFDGWDELSRDSRDAVRHSLMMLFAERFRHETTGIVMIASRLGASEALVHSPLDQLRAIDVLFPVDSLRNAAWDVAVLSDFTPEDATKFVEDWSQCRGGPRIPMPTEERGVLHNPLSLTIYCLLVEEDANSVERVSRNRYALYSALVSRILSSPHRPNVPTPSHEEVRHRRMALAEMAFGEALRGSWASLGPHTELPEEAHFDLFVSRRARRWIHPSFCAFFVGEHLIRSDASDLDEVFYHLSLDSHWQEALSFACPSAPRLIEQVVETYSWYGEGAVVSAEPSSQLVAGEPRQVIVARKLLQNLSAFPFPAWRPLVDRLLHASSHLLAIDSFRNSIADYVVATVPPLELMSLTGARSLSRNSSLRDQIRSTGEQTTDYVTLERCIYFLNHSIRIDPETRAWFRTLLVDGPSLEFEPSSWKFMRIWLADQLAPLAQEQGFRSPEAQSLEAAGFKVDEWPFGLGAVLERHHQDTARLFRSRVRPEAVREILDSYLQQDENWRHRLRGVNKEIPDGPSGVTGDLRAFLMNALHDFGRYELYEKLLVELALDDPQGYVRSTAVSCLSRVHLSSPMITTLVDAARRDSDSHSRTALVDHQQSRRFRAIQSLCGSTFDQRAREVVLRAIREEGGLVARSAVASLGNAELHPTVRGVLVARLEAILEYAPPPYSNDEAASRDYSGAHPPSPESRMRRYEQASLASALATSWHAPSVRVVLTRAMSDKSTRDSAFRALSRLEAGVKLETLLDMAHAQEDRTFLRDVGQEIASYLNRLEELPYSAERVAALDKIWLALP